MNLPKYPVLEANAIHVYEPFVRVRLAHSQKKEPRIAQCHPTLQPELSMDFVHFAFSRHTNSHLVNRYHAR